MKKNMSITGDFESLVVKIADKNVGNMTRAKAKKIIAAVAESQEPMFWLVCVMLGLKEGSSYAQGAHTLTKKLGW